MGDKPFLIRPTLDDDGVPLPDKEDNRFLRARAGDMLMVPFQCEICHFRNMEKRDPARGDAKDDEVLEYIRRASLDAFWSRETSTVKKNLGILWRAENFCERLSLKSVSPPLGPFPLNDVLGMKAAIAVLDKSLDKGIYERLVQWETFRKTRSAITNVHQASAFGLTDAIGSYERSRVWISNVETHSFWFSRFMTGLHKRVGEVVKSDWPVPIEVMKYVDRVLNKAWNLETDPDARKRIAEMGAWYIMGFCVGLRGEEMLLIELAGTAASLRFLNQEEDAHFIIRLKGRTKGSLIAGKGFEIPCIGTTEVSRLKPGRWVRRLVEVVQSEGRTTGKLFQRQLTVPRLLEFEEDWFDVLVSVQTNTDLIDADIDLREKAGIYRSLRRGVTSHAINMQVNPTLVKAVNRWRNEIKGNGRKGTYEMIDHYAELGTLKPTFLRYSKVL